MGSQFLLCDMCQASREMGNRFTLYGFRHSYGLERDHRPCFRLLLLPDHYHWCNNKVQTHCSISKCTIYDEASTSQCGVSCVKTSSKRETLSDSDSNDEDVGQANNNMDCDPTFAGAYSSNEPHLLTQGDLNDIVRDLNLSKKQAELLGFSVDKKNQLDVTCCILYFSSNSCSTCFGQPCAHHQELTTA